MLKDKKSAILNPKLFFLGGGGTWIGSSIGMLLDLNLPAMMLTIIIGMTIGIALGRLEANKSNEN
ncbi:hypothetical protein GCM10017161_06160 [Thalassotalea marina]|uniref:Uncharacterized protein n=1 Tax=Thalassotalea marina TaxID=1673741 RepID=A0A919EHQ6_9GAMM|nr:hypothetical protein GCM10017161_06160 [Thalassotalea marina]